MCPVYVWDKLISKYTVEVGGSDFTRGHSRHCEEQNLVSPAMAAGCWALRGTVRREGTQLLCSSSPNPWSPCLSLRKTPGRPDGGTFCKSCTQTVSGGNKVRGGGPCAPLRSPRSEDSKDPVGIACHPFSRLQRAQGAPGG